MDMNESDFDKWIKGHMDNVPHNYTTDGAWDCFTKRWKNNPPATNDDDDIFDQYMAEKIQTYITDTSPYAWSRFLNYRKLKLENSTGIIRVKVMETTAILLMLLTWVQWWESTSPVKSDTPFYFDNDKVIDESPPFMAMAKSSDFQSDELNSHQNVTDAHHVNSVNTDNRWMGHSYAETSENEHLLESTVSKALIPTAGVIPLSTDTPRWSRLILKTGQNRVSDITYESEKESFQRQKTDIADHPTINTEDVLIPLPTDDIRPAYSEYPLILPMSVHLPPHYSRWFISAYIACDANLINTPFDKIYALTSYQREFMNSSVGLGISHRVKSMEYHFDLGYARRNYEPRQFAESFGPRDYYYSEISLDRISFDIINPSVMMKYHFVDRKKWSAYLAGTAALNVILNADYDITEIKILGRPPSERYLPESPRLEEKPFIKGIFHDKSLADNYFISSGLGLGLEMTITEATFLFLEISHKRFLWSADIGIGPNKDKIHTTTFKLGIKKEWNSF